MFLVFLLDWLNEALIPLMNVAPCACLQFSMCSSQQRRIVIPAPPVQQRQAAPTVIVMGGAPYYYPQQGLARKEYYFKKPICNHIDSTFCLLNQIVTICLQQLGIYRFRLSLTELISCDYVRLYVCGYPAPPGSMGYPTDAAAAQYTAPAYPLQQNTYPSQAPPYPGKTNMSMRI